MMKLALIALTLTSTVQAYVPTVESLFRHGANPDVTVNGVSLTLVVKRVQPGGKTSAQVEDASLLRTKRDEDYYKIFFTKNPNDALKVAQTRYNNSAYTENSLIHKIYYPNFTAYTIKPSVEEVEKGLFFALLHSITYNNGSHIINYLRTLGVPVKLNSDLINREKINLLAEYKRYLVAINKDRNAKKTESNPLRPEDGTAREKIEQIMGESMYVDTKQVKLSREDGEMSWLITAGPLEAVVSYKEREVKKLRYRSVSGEFEVTCKDYWLANGTHRMPRFMQIKSFNGETFQVEVTNLRHYQEKEDDLVRRLKKWDQILKHPEHIDPRPEFLL